MAETKARRLLDDGTSPSPSNEQVRKSTLDYMVSRKATNPALAIHPAPCADLLPNGRMPVTHFPVAFLLASLAASGGGFTKPKQKKKKGHCITVRLMISLCSAF